MMMIFFLIDQRINTHEMRRIEKNEIRSNEMRLESRDMISHSKSNLQW